MHTVSQKVHTCFWIGRNRKKYCNAKKDAKRVVYMAMDQKAQETVEKVDLCRDGREFLEFPNKELGRRKMLLALIVLKMKVRQSK